MTARTSDSSRIPNNRLRSFAIGSVIMASMFVSGCTTHTLQPMRLGAEATLKERLIFEVKKVRADANWAVKKLVWSSSPDLQSDGENSSGQNSTHPKNVFAKRNIPDWLLMDDIRFISAVADGHWTEAPGQIEIPEGRRGALVWKNGTYHSSQALIIASSRSEQ